MDRIQVISIVASLLFLLFIGRLILKGRLREEYAIIWIVCTLILVTFSIWREGLDYLSELLGIYSPPNMVFTGAIFAVLIYLLHLSLVTSKLQKQNRVLAQEMALLKDELGKRHQ